MIINRLIFCSLLIFSKTVVAQSYDCCVHNVNIISPERDSPLDENKDVFIKGQKIVLIRNSSSSIPKNCRQVVEGKGKFLMPGLSDMHVHLPSDNIEKFLLMNLRAGVTTIRSMRGKISHIDLKHKIANGDYRT
jgi:imidazolonepropionase-like amidohydrolase